MRNWQFLTKINLWVFSFSFHFSYASSERAIILLHVADWSTPNSCHLCARKIPVSHCSNGLFPQWFSSTSPSSSLEWISVLKCVHNNTCLYLPTGKSTAVPRRRNLPPWQVAKLTQTSRFFFHNYCDTIFIQNLTDFCLELEGISVRNFQ